MKNRILRAVLLSIFTLSLQNLTAQDSTKLQTYSKKISVLLTEIQKTKESKKFLDKAKRLADIAEELIEKKLLAPEKDKNFKYLETEHNKQIKNIEEKLNTCKSSLINKFKELNNNSLISPNFDINSFVNYILKYETTIIHSDPDIKVKRLSDKEIRKNIFKELGLEKLHEQQETKKNELEINKLEILANSIQKIDNSKDLLDKAKELNWLAAALKLKNLLKYEYTSDENKKTELLDNEHNKQVRIALEKLNNCETNLKNKFKDLNNNKKIEPDFDINSFVNVFIKIDLLKKTKIPGMMAEKRMSDENYRKYIFEELGVANLYKKEAIN